MLQIGLKNICFQLVNQSFSCFSLVLRLTSVILALVSFNLQSCGNAALQVKTSGSLQAAENTNDKTTKKESDKGANSLQNPEIKVTWSGSTLKLFTNVSPQCVSCHTTPSASKFGGGSIESWKLHIKKVESLVTASRMPPTVIPPEQRKKLLDLIAAIKQPQTEDLAAAGKVTDPSPSTSLPAVAAGTVFNFAAAKPYCVSCHSTGSTMSTWTSAETEQGWKDKSVQIHARLSAATMPPAPSLLPKTNSDALIAYAKTLLPLNAPPFDALGAMSFLEASSYCVSCHSAKNGMIWKGAETLAGWKSNKAKVLSEVKSGAMPDSNLNPKALFPAAAKVRLVKFIEGL